MNNIYTPKSFKYRHWQHECLLQFQLEISRGKKSFALQAWPGAGKTKLATAAFCTARDNGYVDKLIWVVPSTTLKQDIGCYKRNSDLAAEGISAVHDVSNSIVRDCHAQGRCTWPQGADAWMVTYGQIANEPELFKALCKTFRCMLILDEVHHVKDSAAWGKPVRGIGEMAKVVMPMSGTLFTTDGDEIPFVNSEVTINDQGEETRQFKPDYAFGMLEALTIQKGETHPSIRPLTYLKVNAKGSFTYKNLENDKEFQVIHDLKEDGEKAKLMQLLNPKSEMVHQMLQAGIDSLEQFRQVEGDIDAGGLIVCMKGSHAQAIAEVLRTKFGQDPLVVLHDTERASAAIDAFRHSDRKWCVTVRMISEGVDITRLRVGIYLTNYLTPLFLMQWLGRMWRWDSTLDAEQEGHVILPAHETLVKLVSELEDATYEAVVQNEGSDDNQKSSTGTSHEEVTVMTNLDVDAEFDGGIKRGHDFSEDSLERAVNIHRFQSGLFSVGTIAAVLEASRQMDTKNTSVVTKSQEDRELGLNSIKRLSSAITREIVKNPPKDWDGINPWNYVNWKLNKVTRVAKWSQKMASIDEIKTRQEAAKRILAQLRSR